MAKEKKIQVKDLSTQEIQDRIKEEKDRYQKLKFNHVVTPVENPMVMRHARKDIARLFTELRKRQLAELKK